MSLRVILVPNKESTRFLGKQVIDQALKSRFLNEKIYFIYFLQIQVNNFFPNNCSQ